MSEYAGHMSARGKDTWRLSIEMGLSPEGHRLRRTSTFRGSKKAASAELTKRIHELNTGTSATSGKMRLGEYLNRWLADYAKVKVAPKTYEVYADIVQNHLIPGLGHVPLARLTPLHVEAYYREALESGRKNGCGGLSPRSVLHHHRVLKGAMGRAVKWQLIVRNPLDAVDPPRVTPHEVSTLDEDECVRLLQTSVGTELYLPILLAITTGMRRGEILALSWADVDLEDASLVVRRSLEQTKEGVAFKAPKTNKSRRIVLPEFAVKRLRSHKAAQAATKLQIGQGYNIDNLVVCNAEGLRWKPNSFSSSFHAFAKAKACSVTFHGLRHSHASQLLKEGASVKVVSDRLGHSSAVVTMTTYAHTLRGMQEAATEKFDGVLSAAFDNMDKAVSEG